MNANKVFGFWLALLLAYVLAYCFLLKTKKKHDYESEHNIVVSVNGRPWKRVATYQRGGKPIERFFAPLNALDQQLRPDYWKGDDSFTKSLDIPIKASSFRPTTIERPDYWRSVRDTYLFTQSLDIPLNPPIEDRIGIGGHDPWCEEPFVTIKGLRPLIVPAPSLLYVRGLTIRESFGPDDVPSDGMHHPFKKCSRFLPLTPPWERD